MSHVLDTARILSNGVSVIGLDNARTFADDLRDGAMAIGAQWSSRKMHIAELHTLCRRVIDERAVVARRLTRHARILTSLLSAAAVHGAARRHAGPAVAGGRARAPRDEAGGAGRIAGDGGGTVGRSGDRDRDDGRCPVTARTKTPRTRRDESAEDVALRAKLNLALAIEQLLLTTRAAVERLAALCERLKAGGAK